MAKPSRPPKYEASSIQSASSASTLTASDSQSQVTRAVYVGGAGNASFVMENGSSITLDGIPAGTTLPIRVTTLNSASTTATNIIGLF